MTTGMKKPDHAGVSGALTIPLPPELVEAIVDKATEQVLERIDALATHDQREWFNVESAADYLDVSPERVRKLQARREIPYHQEAPGCRVLFRRVDLDEWMRSLRHDARGGPAMSD